MPNSWHQSTYGDRTAYSGDEVDFPLPVRYVSGKQSCSSFLCIYVYICISHGGVRGNLSTCKLLLTKKNKQTGDGTCMIEVSASNEGGIDRLEPSHLKLSLRYLLSKCMGNGKREGGVVKFLGSFVFFASI